MITLQDYIGKIYKDITNAKVQSDIETLAIAQEYVNNPMLKHFSVPNIKIKDLELTIPLAIDTTQVGFHPYKQEDVQTAFVEAFETSYLSFFPENEADLASINTQVSSIASDQSVSSVSKLSTELVPFEVAADDDATRTNKTIGNMVVLGDSSEVTLEQQYSSNLKAISATFGTATYELIEQEIEAEVFQNKLTEELESRLAQPPIEIQKLPVIVETQRLQTLSDTRNMMCIKVNITDDAMEWSTDVDDEGNATQILTYE